MSPVNFITIKEALSQAVSRHFWMSHNGGMYESGDIESFFSKNLNDESLLFDISNNKAVASCGINGTVKNLVIFRSSYGEDFIPGVWVAKDFYKTGPYSFSVSIDGNKYDLAKTDWLYKTSLLDNIFPITKFTGDKVSITLISYAPISKDGKQRPRCLIYGAMVENVSSEKISGSIFCPSVIYSHDCDMPANTSSFIRLADNVSGFPEVPFTLEPGSYIWVPVIISAPGEFGVIEEISSLGSLHWLNSTWSYFKALTGKFSMPDDRFSEEFFQRAVHQCLESIGMDKKGIIAGSSLGSYPIGNYIWMKDMYYSFLPFYMLDTDFFKKGILWFLEYSICPPRNRFEGGISHSLSNLLTPVIMAGLYYESTGDKSFFTENKDVKGKIEHILDGIVESRDNNDKWLFRSIFISDGYAWGHYHTGSNVCAWYSFSSFARIIREVYQDCEKAEYYDSIAAKVKEAIESNCVCEGPFGRQYTEGVDSTGSIPSITKRQDIFKWENTYGTNPDGTIPVMIHDGEESDTTLMPMYGYLDYDNTTYKNLTRFASSEHNLFYIKETKGMFWYNTDGTFVSDATFPGYITGFANVCDYESMNGEHGYMTEIRRLTDVDGSVWWWPYSHNNHYGQVDRGNSKCGWASGVFVGLFITQILGIKYDGPRKTLNFRPFSPTSDFSWEDFRIGESIFSVSYSRKQERIEASVTNKNRHDLSLLFEAPLTEGFAIKEIAVNGKPMNNSIDMGRFFDKQTVKISCTLLPGETKNISIICEHKR